MGKHTNLNSLFKEIEKAVNNSMKKEVSKMAINKLKEHVIEDVYDAYTSKAKDPYPRTGGLLQDSNIETVMISDDTLSVRSTRRDGEVDVSKVIEYGEGYTWQDSEIYKTKQKRPFHAETAKEIDEKGLAKKAIQEGLKRQGIDSK